MVRVGGFLPFLAGVLGEGGIYLFIELGHLRVGGASFAEGVMFRYEGSYIWGNVGDKNFSEARWDVVFGGCD